ncbi:MAG: gliding motility-associated ABC transporter permease subunit GldF, partial [Bacteroidota bacterium]
ILAVFICFFFYFGFEGLSNYRIFGDVFYLEALGMDSHYQSISRGVIDTRDLIYFLSVTAFFIVLTKLNIKHSQK